MGLSERLDDYRKDRPFGTTAAVQSFLSKPNMFVREKRIYFDEVENANVWSFYLVDRDLHHTFEEYLRTRGLPDYASWSRRQRLLDPTIERATFPISETATRYFKPVPEAGDVVHYALEVLEVYETSALFGFVAFRERAGKLAESASMFALWYRILVEYIGDERKVVPLPASLATVLSSDLAH